MALEGLLQIRDSQPASADLSSHQFKIVNFDSSGELQLAAVAGAGGFILLDKPNAQGVEGTILLMGKGKAIAGDTIAAGDYLTNEVTTGHVVALTGTAGASEVVVGIALEAAVDGDLVKIFVAPSSTQGD
jgi:hypothetical protein